MNKYNYFYLTRILPNGMFQYPRKIPKPPTPAQRRRLALRGTILVLSMYDSADTHKRLNSVDMCGYTPKSYWLALRRHQIEIN